MATMATNFNVFVPIFRFLKKDGGGGATPNIINLRDPVLTQRFSRQNADTIKPAGRGVLTNDLNARCRFETIILDAQEGMTKKRDRGVLTYARVRFLWQWRTCAPKEFFKTAGGGGRTHNLKLGKLALCQLSYARVILSFMPSSPCFVKIFFSFLYFGDILRWNGTKNVRAVAIALGFEK